MAALTPCLFGAEEAPPGRRALWGTRGGNKKKAVKSHRSRIFRIKAPWGGDEEEK